MSRICSCCGFDFTEYENINTDGVCTACKKENICEFCLTITEEEYLKYEDAWKCPNCSGVDIVSLNTTEDILWEDI